MVSPREPGQEIILWGLGFHPWSGVRIFMSSWGCTTVKKRMSTSRISPQCFPAPFLLCTRLRSSSLHVAHPKFLPPGRGPQPERGWLLTAKRAHAERSGEDAEPSRQLDADGCARQVVRRQLEANPGAHIFIIAWGAGRTFPGLWSLTFSLSLYISFDDTWSSSPRGWSAFGLTPVRPAAVVPGRPCRLRPGPKRKWNSASASRARSRARTVFTPSDAPAPSYPTLAPSPRSAPSWRKHEVATLSM